MSVVDRHTAEELRLARSVVSAVAQTEAQVPPAVLIAFEPLRQWLDVGFSFVPEHALAQLRLSRALSRELERAGALPAALMQAYKPLGAFYKKDLEAGSVG